MAKRKTHAKTKKRFILKLTPEMFIIAGVFFVTLSLTHNYLRNRSLAPVVIPSNISSSPFPAHLYIPWFLDVNVVSTTSVDQISLDSVNYIASSVPPGEGGNTIIYGHNKRDLMGNIRALKGGEVITLTLSSGDIKEYQVISTQELSPAETTPLMPTDFEVLTLYTCSGFFDSQRFIVRATPVLDQVDAL